MPRFVTSPQPILDDPLLDLAAVARALGVSRETARHYVRREGLPVVRVTPRTLRVRASDLDAWLTSRTASGGDAA